MTKNVKSCIVLLIGCTAIGIVDALVGFKPGPPWQYGVNQAMSIAYGAALVFSRL